MCVCVCVNVSACACTRVALLIQHAPRIRHIVRLSRSNIFFDIISNGTIFGKSLLNVKCVFWFSLQLLSKTCPILIIIQRDIVINVKTSSCKVPVILVRF